MTDGEKQIAESGADFVLATAGTIREWSRVLDLIDGESEEDNAMLHDIRRSMIQTANRLMDGARLLRNA